jgi:hypothetical protein
MILLVDDCTDKVAAMRNALGFDPEPDVRVARDWAQYEVLRHTLRAGDAVCFDVVSFPGAPGRESIRQAARTCAADGQRVVMWSEVASPEWVPANCLCLRARANRPSTLARAADYLKSGAVVEVPNEFAWGTWEPPPPVADLLPFDLLCQGYLAVAASAFTSPLAEALRADEFGRGVLADAARPAARAAIERPREWFAPAVAAVAAGPRPADQLWAALAEPHGAVAPVRALYDALSAAAPLEPADWHRLVCAAAAGLRALAERGGL